MSEPNVAVTSIGRLDQVPLEAGVVHLPAEFREVARLANKAGLEGYEFIDAETGIDADAAIEAIKKDIGNAPGLSAFDGVKTRILITFRSGGMKSRSSIENLLHHLREGECHSTPQCTAEAIKILEWILGIKAPPPPAESVAAEAE
jgi:hypothetical protein